MNRWAPWLAAILALVFLYLIRAILGPFIIAIILAYVLVPGVDALAQRFRVRRFFIVAGIYAILILLLLLLFISLRPTIALEFRSLREDSVEVVHRALVQLFGGEEIDIAGNVLHSQVIARTIVTNAQEALNSPSTALQFAEALFQRVAETILTLIVLFYLLLDWEKLVAFAFRFIPPAARPRVSEIAFTIHRVLGQYLRGQLILIAVMATLTWLVLEFVFHLPFAFVIGIATGFLEIIPLVGPVLAAGIASVAALAVGGPNLAIAVVVFYTILRQVEDQLIAPNVLGRAVDLHPVAAIFAVLAGGVLWGTLGLVLGVPVAAAVKVILDAVQPPVAPEQVLVVTKAGGTERVEAPLQRKEDQA
jgi:predicted PurR-regulated permease PerM